MNDQKFRYQGLYYLTYVLYFVSYFIPAYAGGSMSFCCGGSEIWLGWKCALGAFAIIFSEKFLFGILLSMPNFLMIVLLFSKKRIGRVVFWFILLFNVSSCSYWWIQALADNNIGSLLPGYWLWLISIAGNNIILLLNRRK